MSLFYKIWQAATAHRRQTHEEVPEHRYLKLGLYTLPPAPEIPGIKIPGIPAPQIVSAARQRQDDTALRNELRQLAAYFQWQAADGVFEPLRPDEEADRRGGARYPVGMENTVQHRVNLLGIHPDMTYRGHLKFS